MTMQDAKNKYRLEYSQSDNSSGWKDAGQSFYDLATAVHYFHRESSSNRDRVYRVTDMTGDMVYNGKFSAKISGAVLNEETSGEPKTETPTMSYTVQWQDKDGKWYLDDERQTRHDAFARMYELDNGDHPNDARATHPRRIIAEDDTPIAYGRHRPISASERPKQKPFWIVTDGRPKTQYSSLAEACMAATTNAGLVATRYIFQAVRVIDWREEEIGE